MSVRTESLGTPRWRALRELALYFSENGVTEVALSEVPELQATLKLLVDAGVLVERAGSVRFVHETMYDHVFARAFVDDGRCLIDEVLGGPQDLSGRAFIRRILSFERGVDRVRYENSVRALLRDKRVRFHLRDVVFDVLREDLAPAPSDWDLLAPMVIDEKSEDHLAAWGVATQPHWLDVIDRTGTLLRWMSSELIEDRNRATNLLRHVVRNAPGRAATLLWPFLEFGPEWHRRIGWIVTGAAPHNDRRLLDFLVAATRAGVFDGRDNESLWMAVHDLPSERPYWGVELLSEYLRRGLGESTEPNPFDHVFPKNSYFAEEFTRALSHRAAPAFARDVLPIVLSIIEATAEANVAFSHGDPWAWRQPGPDQGFDGALYDSLDRALNAVAARRPSAFERLMPALVERAHYASARFLLYRAWSANPAVFWGAALKQLLGPDDPFSCGYMSSPYWTTRELIHALQSQAPTGSLMRLEQRLLDFYPEWERTADGRAARGSAQFTLLDAIPDRHLTDKGRRRPELVKPGETLCL